MSVPAEGFAVGDLVQVWFDDGRGGGYVFGVVTRSGPRAVGITWESGRRQMLKLSTHGGRLALVPYTLRDDARKALTRGGYL